MQSSFMNSEKLRLNAARHPPSFRRVGEPGVRPTCAVAVDKAEAAEPCLRLALPPATEDQARGRADPAGQHEAETQRASGDRRQVGAQLAADVGCLADALAEVVRRPGQLLALRLDVAANLLERARVPTGHCS
jgi:hypothetical protein